MAKLLAKVMGSLILLALAVLSGLVGWIQSAARTEPERVLAIDAGQADALMVLAERRGLGGEGSPDQVFQLGAALLRRQPLNDAPLVYAAFKYVAQGDVVLARHAFALAAKRQPRNVRALVWLATDAIANEQFESADHYLERLARLNPADKEIYADMLASFAADERGVILLEQRLAEGRPLAQQALVRLNASSTDVPLLLRLNIHFPEGQAELMRRIVEQRGPLEAFVAWLALAPQSETRGFIWPFDPVFVGSTAPPPFNWTLENGADLLEQGGLHARYSGHGSSTFATQLVILSPGGYHFLAEMDGDGAAAGGGFEWTLACEPSKLLLGRVPVQGLTPTLSEHAFGFVVPEDGTCAVQQLTLRGLPGQVPVTARTTIRRVAIQTGVSPG